MSLAATTKGSLGEPKHAAGDAAHIAAGVGGKGGQEASAGFLGEVGLLEYALGAVHVREVHDRARVAAVEDGRQTDTGLQWLDDGEMDVVVDNVAIGLEVDRVDDLIGAVLFVAVEILGLAAVSCQQSGSVSISPILTSSESLTNQSSARRGHRWAGRP